MIVFNTGLNAFTKKYLTKNVGEDGKFLAESFEFEYKKALAEIVEQVLFFDKVSIKVYGENIALVVLINELGLKQVLELVEEGGIEFLLWTPILTTFSTDELIGKVNPIQSGNLNSLVHCDPNESIKEGLRSLLRKVDRSERRDLERKVAKVYKIPNQKFVHDAASIVTSAYSTNKLQDFGFPKEKEVQWLSHDERFKLLSFGDDILETSILSEFKYSSFGNYKFYNLSKQSFDEIKSATNVLDGVGEIFRTERLPDIKELIIAGRIDLKYLIKLRRKTTSRKFRTWLESNSKEDSEYITKEYIDEIANHKGFFETNRGKFIKTVGMYGIGGIIGTAVGGLPGAFLGTTTGALVQPAADLGLSFIDTYFLDGLLKGWQPKLFINEYEKIIATQD